MTMTSTKIAHDDLRKSKSLRLLSSTTSIPRGGSGSGTYSSLISSAQDSLLIQTGVVHQLLEIIDVLGTFVFAFAGAYKAGKKGMDLLGMMILASITAIGGGTVRDLLMGTGGKAIFWLRNPIYIQISFVTTIATYLLWPIFEREFGIKDSARTICTADAFAMAAFCVLGTKRGVEKNLAPPMWVVSGVITSVFGGIIRDILCGEPPRVMYPYKSMLSAGPILGSVIYTLLTSSKQKFDEDLVSVTAFLVTFSVRTWSFDHPWRLPHWPDETIKGRKKEKK
ncbi:unnamed protein product [Cylindrotheca closterium]|uniref:Glycine transporter domain-containing protein n=1 Tax=Cylindrotheca closterium TaxID=2856 RepID=A0AAD2PUR3_9STRA|nr:unnamed protein product [Cylindrotheca closterium]